MVFEPRGQGNIVTSMPNGTSNTVMVGERIQNCNVSIALGYSSHGCNDDRASLGMAVPRSRRRSPVGRLRLVDRWLGEYQLGYCPGPACRLLPPNGLL